MKYETFDEILLKIDEDIASWYSRVNYIKSNYVDENNKVKTSEYDIYKKKIEDLNLEYKRILEEDIEFLISNNKKIRNKQAALIDLTKEHINQKGRIPRRIALGKKEIKFKDGSYTGYIPRLIDFPFEKSMYISGDEQFKLIHKVILRLLYALPLEKFQITVFDPNGYGKVIQEFNSLFSNEHIFPCKKILTNKNELNEHLKEVERYIENLRSNIFDYKFRNWEEYNRFLYSKNEIGSILPYKLFIFMDVPQDLDDETFTKFKNLIKNGKECGILVIFSFDKNLLEAKDTYNNKITIDLKECINKSIQLHKVIDEDRPREYKNIYTKHIGEKLPEIEFLQEKLDEYIKILEQKKSKYNIEDFLDKSNRFNRSGKNPLSIPIGYKDVDSSVLELVLEGPVAHCLVGGTTGSGKTTFLNEMILSVINRYSPKDLQLILLDFKEAVEFTAYTKPKVLPHVKLVATDADESYGLDVLKHINNLISSRGKLFKENNCKDINDYNNFGENNIPRILLIIDEFQVLFQSEFAEEIKKNLIDIAKKGRSFGVHMILSTQSIKGLDLTGIFQQIKAKIILNCSPEDSETFFGQNLNDEASKIKRPYAILNTGSGEKEDNIKFRIPWENGILEKNVEELYRYCKNLNLRAENKIFDGTIFPNHPDEFEYKKNGELELKLGQISNYAMNEFCIKFDYNKKQNLVILTNDKKAKNILMECIKKSILNNTDYDLFYYYDNRINDMMQSYSLNKTNNINDLSKMMSKTNKKKVLIIDEVNISKLEQHTKNNEFSDLIIDDFENESNDLTLENLDDYNEILNERENNIDIFNFIENTYLTNEIVIAFYPNATDFKESFDGYVNEFENVVVYKLNESEMNKITEYTKIKDFYYYIFNQKIQYSFRPYKTLEQEEDLIDYGEEIFKYND